MGTRMRIKGTPFWGEITGSGGTVEQPLVELTMRDGSKVYYKAKDLTFQTVEDAVDSFIWSVFVKDGSRKNQIIFFASAVLLGFIVGTLLFL